MSSLNINNLYETMYERNLKRYEKFDGILQKIHNRIKYNAGKEKTYCFFQIPEFIIGTPLYNIEDLKRYIIESLKKDGFQLMYIDPNWLFITWEYKKPKTYQPDKGKKDKKKNYKLTDDYKPTGIVYNENDLSSMKDKLKLSGYCELSNPIRSRKSTSFLSRYIRIFCVSGSPILQLYSSR